MHGHVFLMFPERKPKNPLSPPPTIKSVGDLLGQKMPDEGGDRAQEVLPQTADTPQAKPAIGMDIVKLFSCYEVA